MVTCGYRLSTVVPVEFLHYCCSFYLLLVDVTVVVVFMSVINGDDDGLRYTDMGLTGHNLVPTRSVPHWLPVSPSVLEWVGHLNMLYHVQQVSVVLIPSCISFQFLYIFLVLLINPCLHLSTPSYLFVYSLTCAQPRTSVPQAWSGTYVVYLRPAYTKSTGRET